MRKILLMLFCSALLASCGSSESPIDDGNGNNPPGPDPIPENPVKYTNPVFLGFPLPDPDVIRGDDGYFYLYATEEKADNNNHNVPILKSADLVNWEKIGSVFTDENHPHITTEYDAVIWAPSINKVGNKYIMYYSQPGKNYKHAIGIATADSPAGPFTEHGKLIDSDEQGVDLSIDAYLYQENGRNYLFWGSFRAISIIELTADGMAIKPGAERIVVAGGQYEASCVVKHDGYYYLIVSIGDYSKNGTYRLVVGRSTVITGPYRNKRGEDMKSVNHELILQGTTDKKFTSPGHCSRVITDDAGRDWILYHSYPSDKNLRYLMLDELKWTGGWPIVEGLQPSTTHAAPIFNTPK